MSGTYVVYNGSVTSGGGGGGGASNVGALDTQVASPDGLVIAGSSLFAQSASAINPGLVSSAAQSFAGVKTFNSSPIAPDPTTATQVATKNYVDTQLAAFQPIEDVRAASAGVNYPGVMVGNVLTITATGAISIDGVTPSANERVLLKDQSTTSQNGVYVVTTVGSIGVAPVLTRASDFNTAALANAGNLIPVLSGTVNKITSWLQTATVVTINSDPLIFLQYSANPANVPISVGLLNGAAVSSNGAVIGSSSLYLQSASATNPGLVSSAVQTFAGAKTFSSAPVLSSLSASLPLQLDGSNNIISQAINLSGTGIVGSISLTAQVSGILPASNSSGLNLLSGSVSLTAQVSGILPIANGGSTGSNTGDVSLAAVGAVPNANGATIAAGQVFNLQPANATNPGVVTAVAQVFGGTKSFATTIQTTNTIGSISFSSSTGGQLFNLIYPGSLGTSGQSLAVGSAGALNWVSSLVSPMTTLGDVIVGGTSGAAQRLAVGTGAQVLVSSAGATNGVAWGTNNFQDSTTVSSGYSVQGWATINSFSITTWRTGDRLGGRAYAVPTTASSSQLPAGLIIPFPVDYTKANIGPTNIVGRAWRLSGGYPSASVGPMPLFISSSSAILQMSIQGNGTQGTTQSTTGTIIGWSANGVVFEFDNIPIAGWSSWS